MRGMQLLNDAIREIRPKDENDLRDAGAPVDCQISFAAELVHHRAASLGLSSAMVDQAVERGRDACLSFYQLCDSPIEKRILPWLVFEDYGPFLSVPAVIHSPKAFGPLPGADLLIIPQFAFARYRLDFAVVGRIRDHMKIICVECDGKGQHCGDHDAVRDAYLAAWGIPTVRLTGSDTYRTPRLASQLAADHMRAWAEGL